MDIKRKYIKILQDLYNNKRGLLSYTLYSRYDMSPSDIIEFIDEYKANGIIQVDKDFRILLTPTGLSSIESVLSKIKCDNQEKTSYIYERQTESRLGVFEPYIPNISFLQQIENGEK